MFSYQPRYLSYLCMYLSFPLFHYFLRHVLSHNLFIFLISHLHQLALSLSLSLTHTHTYRHTHTHTHIDTDTDPICYIHTPPTNTSYGYFTQTHSVYITNTLTPFHTSSLSLTHSGKHTHTRSLLFTHCVLNALTISLSLPLSPILRLKPFSLCHYSSS